MDGHTLPSRGRAQDREHLRHSEMVFSGKREQRGSWSPARVGGCALRGLGNRGPSDIPSSVIVDADRRQARLREIPTFVQEGASL